MIVEVGFEPTKLAQQILSLPPLTTRTLNCIHFWEKWSKTHPPSKEGFKGNLGSPIILMRGIEPLTTRLKVERSAS